jgi:hypothetical protein
MSAGTHDGSQSPNLNPCVIHHAKLFHPVAIACKIAAPTRATVNQTIFRPVLSLSLDAVFNASISSWFDRIWAATCR